jgi:hypothetical protein
MDSKFTVAAIAGAVPSSASAAAAPRTSLFSPDRACETQEVGWVVIVSRLEVEAPVGDRPFVFFYQLHDFSL